MTLPWAVGPRRYVADQLLTNADVIRAMREPAQLRHDSQTEFAFIRESLSESAGCTIFRVLGQMILEEESAARTFEEVEPESLEWLFVHGSQSSVRSKPRRAQASRVGYERLVDVARLLPWAATQGFG